MKCAFRRARLMASLICLLLSASSGLFAQTVTFKTNDYAVSNPYSVIAADVFGSGRPAIITANQGDNTLTVLGNFGNGVFASNATYHVGYIGYSPRAIVAADWNGDGKIDLVSIGYTNSTILTNYNSGQFASNATLNVGGTSAIAFDLMGNGKPGLVIGGGNSVTVFTNNGSGTLGLSTTFPVSGPVYSMAASDINLDGTLDLLVANYNDGSVIVFTNNGGGLLISNMTYTFSPYLNTITAADLNCDGFPDLIVGPSQSFYGLISIWTNNGSGVFGSNTTVVTHGNSCLVAADFNGDGFTDLAILAGGGPPGIVSISTNSSAGFGNYITIGAGLEPQTMAMADFNGDGKPDLVLGDTGSHVTVMLNSTLFASPPLNILSAAGNQSVVYWKSPAPDSVLQATTNLDNPNWFTVTNGRPIQGVTVSNASPTLFFRLISQ